MIGLVNKQWKESELSITEQQLAMIDKAAERLDHKRLDGNQVWTKEEVLRLPTEEVDLARALLIYQFESEANSKQKIREYEATLDLMALQILAKLKKYPSAEDVINEINEFIFHEMRFRFPPHSLYAKDIDMYTFLSSVMDSRLGVCLGVSTLYLCLAQRLGLDLEIITPPGHIYLRYNNGSKIINIETTARGIHLPTETYLGINTQYLQRRTMKEVVGMAFFNQASVMSEREDHKAAIELYELALQYVEDEPLFKMLLGMHYLFHGQKAEGTQLLKQVSGVKFEGAIVPESMPEDYIKGRVDIAGLKMIFQRVDETRESILAKQRELKDHLQKYPKFRAGLMMLATTYLQLGRTQEAYEVLLSYHKIDPTNPVVEYYLTVVCVQRYDYIKAWSFYQTMEKILSEAHHTPRMLKELKSSLQRVCPCPS
jgi:tetratricopeptide (TPR) repeat protein